MTRRPPTRKIRLDEIFVDPAYQRDRCDRTIEWVKSAYDHRACGAIMLSDRVAAGLPTIDGRRYAIIDGQQRSTAIQEMGYTHVTATVEVYASIEEEAHVFWLVNRRRRAPTQMECFKSALKAKHPLEVEVAEFLAGMGLAVGTEKSGSNSVECIRFVSGLLTAWKRDKNAAKEALLLFRDIEDNDVQLKGDFFTGFWWLLHNGIQIDTKDKAKLAKVGTPAIERAGRRYALDNHDPSMRRDQQFAHGVFIIVNKGRRRNKLKWPTAAKEAGEDGMK